MSNKELDNLFRNKLERLEQKPSADAWKKIQAGTPSKKGAPVLWLRIAAAVLLLITSGLVIWQVTKSDISNHSPISTTGDEPPSVTQNLAQIQPEKAETTPADAEVGQPTTVPEASQPEAASKPVMANRDKVLAQNKVSQQSTPTKRQVANQEKQMPAVIENIDVKENVAANSLPDATIEKQSASDQKKADQGRTLEFDLSDFNKTALAVNEEQPADVNNGIEAEGKSKKGLNKVIDLMKELKSEANIGELREAKNELFAFNFKKENKDDSK